MKTVEEIAREAGDDWEHTLKEDRKFLEAFAALVRAEAQAEEREACAKVCDAWHKWGTDGALLAKAMRERGNT